MKNVKVGDSVKVVDGYPQRGLIEGEKYVVDGVDGEEWITVGGIAWWFYADRFEKVLEPYNEIGFRDAHYGEFSAFRKNDGSVEIELDGLCGYTYLTISEKEFEKLVDMLNEIV